MHIILRNALYPLTFVPMRKTILTGMLLSFVFPILCSQASAVALSRNDQIFREDLQYRLDVRLQKQVTTVIDRYKVRIATMNKTDADRLTDSILLKVEAILRRMQLSQPLDKSLAKKADDKYLAYTLLKFELMLLK